MKQYISQRYTGDDVSGILLAVFELPDGMFSQILSPKKGNSRRWLEGDSVYHVLKRTNHIFDYAMGDRKTLTTRQLKGQDLLAVKKQC